MYITISSNSSLGIKAPVWVKDGTFRLSTRFLSINLLSHHQLIRSPTVCSPISNFTLSKLLPENHLGSLETLRKSICSPCLAQQQISFHSKLLFWFVWSHCVTHKNQFCNINSNNLMCRLPGPCCKNFLYILALFHITVPQS